MPYRHRWRKKRYIMSESQETATAAAEPKQATNMSVSAFAERRKQELTPAPAQAEEVPEESQILGSETNEVEQPEEIQEEAVASEAEEETAEVEEGTTEQDVLSQIELDDMTEEELRELSDKLGSRAVARFGELTAKRKAAEAELEKIKTEMSSQVAPEVKDSENPYRELSSVEELQNVASEVEQVIEWAEDLIFDSDGYSADDVITEVEGKELTKADVRKHLQKARKAEKKFIPAQLKKIQRIENAEKSKTSLQEKAEKEFSWMKEEGDIKEKYEGMLNDSRLQGLDKFDPEVAAQLPYLLAHAANSMYGRKLVKEGTPSRSARLNPPSGTPGSAKSERQAPATLKNLQNASNQFKKNGSKNDFIRMRTLQLSQ